MLCLNKRLGVAVSRNARWIAMLLLAGLIAGCTRIPLSSLWSLRQFSFETFDPAALRLAMHLPSAYAVPREAMRIEVKVGRGEGQPVHVEHFAMQESRDPGDALGLPMLGSADGRWVVLRFDASETERVRVFRETMIALKRDRQAHGSLEMSVSPRLCRTGAMPLGSPRFSGALMWSRDKGYVLLLRDDDLGDALKTLSGPHDLSALPAC